MIRKNARLYAILGDPIAQALSPIVHNAAFAANGDDAVFVGLRVPTGQLEEAFTGAKAMNFAGLAITMPHKQAIIPLLDEVEPFARRLGAVNVVVNESGRWIGHNTDGDGFVEGLRRNGADPASKRVFLFGAGGAARGIAAALQKHGAESLTVCNLWREEAEPLIASLAGFAAFAEFSRADAADALAEADIVINATSLGMAGSPSPHLDCIDWAGLKPGAFFADVVHKPLHTPFLAAAERHGHRVMGGEAMLLDQATLAYTLWTGKPAPRQAMAGALAQASPDEPAV